MLKAAVFLDRDGVLVEPVIRGGLPFAPLRWEDFRILPGVAEAAAMLRAVGYVLIVVTNQPEVRRRLLDPALLEEFHQRLRESVVVDEVVACPHDDGDDCRCRKPRPGMILEAAERHGIDLARSYLVGDTERDLGAAQAAGVRLVLIDAPYNQDLPEAHRVRDLAAAARWILARRPPVVS
jgi:D-glycero-D-manno-heptose 1,7-bisphosphate phosphatase